MLLSFIIFVWLQDTSAIWDKDVSLMATEILSDCSKEEVECLFLVKLKINPLATGSFVKVSKVVMY